MACPMCHGTGAVNYWLKSGGLEYQYVARCVCEAGPSASLPRDVKRMDEVFTAEQLDKQFGWRGKAHTKLMLTVGDLDRAGIPPRFHSWTFKSFPDQSGNKPHLALAKKWVTAHPEGRSDIVMFGPTGVGKTGLSVAILHALLENGELCGYIDAQWLIQELRGTFDNDGKGPSETDLLRSFIEIPTLVVDDLTAVKESDYTRDIMRILVDRRHQHKRPTIITLNLEIEKTEHEAELTHKALDKAFGSYVYDRLQQRGVLWNMIGESYRQERTVVAGPWKDTKPVPEERPRPKEEFVRPEAGQLKWREALARSAMREMPEAATYEEGDDDHE